MKFLRKLILWFLALALLGGGLLYVYCRYVAPFDFQITQIEKASAHVPAAAEGLKILCFADTHFGPYYDAEDFRPVVEAINGQEPDLVFFLGDLFDALTDTAVAENMSEVEFQEYTAEISAALAEIKAPLGKYAVFGNHDYGGGAEKYYPGIVAAGGFTLLVNEQAVLPELGLSIIGIDDVLIGYGDPEAASAADPALFNIVLSHAPDVADEIIAYDADLILSGHTHGRQIHLPFFGDTFQPPYGKKYIRGAFSFENARETLLYVNSGLGMTQLPFRFQSPPELTVVTLRAE